MPAGHRGKRGTILRRTEAASGHPLLVRGEPARLATGAAAGHKLGLLSLLLSATGALATIPCTCFRSPPGLSNVAALFLGSMLRRVPALLIFAACLGMRIRIASQRVPAPAIPAVAALLPSGFSPILRFLRATTSVGGGDLKARLERLAR